MKKYYPKAYLRAREKKVLRNGKTLTRTYYQCILRYKDDETGKWKQKTKSLPEGTKPRAAQKLLNEWWDEEERKAIAEGMVKPRDYTSQGLTVREAVELFLESQLKARKIEPSTYQTQTFYARKHVFPYLGDIAFQSLSWQRIQDWENELRGKLSVNSVGICHSLLRKTYKKAYEKEQIHINPFDHVDPPKKEKTEINYLDSQGKQKLKAAVDAKWEKGSPYWTAVYLAYYTGMRASEVCGLQWRDVKLSVGKFKISRAIGRTEKGKPYLKGTKNKASEREIIMNSHISAVLEARREVMKAEIAESVYKDKINFSSLFVVGDIDGSFLSATALASNFSRFSKQNGILGVVGKHITLHGLRHTFATDSVKNHMDIKSLASILGHEKADMTLNTYASADEEAKRLSMEAMDKFYSQEDEQDW